MHTYASGLRRVYTRRTHVGAQKLRMRTLRLPVCFTVGRHPFWVLTNLYQTRKKPFRRARSMEPSGAAHQPRALGTANPARILACLSLLRRLRARARPSRPTTFSDNMCALDDERRWTSPATPAREAMSKTRDSIATQRDMCSVLLLSFMSWLWPVQAG